MKSHREYVCGDQMHPYQCKSSNSGLPEERRVFKLILFMVRRVITLGSQSRRNRFHSI